ncbi:MAG TPA: heterocyst frequency control protein PatD [Leptolyngbyaceae cyanobacterium M65_K2018_010]|nr:heterocyst frequency control protein PatD [Leptolyngbyaceae cyanobacterium M65_K2018_010]
MIPEAIQTLQAQLTQLHTQVQQANPDGTTLQGQFLAAQQQFQSQVLLLGDDSNPALPPILTEMNRTFRLLAMDVAFLQAARQPLKAQQRQQHMGEKILHLLGFCQALSQGLNSVD